MAENLKAPSHLKPATRAWWRRVHQDYTLEAHHERLLILACEAFDRACAARAVIDAEGMTFLDRFGQPRARPEIAVERDARTSFARLLRELDLDTEGPGDASRPPALRSNRRL